MLARRLLTDQGYSETRRREAARRVALVYGEGTVEVLRAHARAGQPDGERARTEAPTEPAPSEMLLVRPGESAPPDALERIADFVALCGGLVLMVTVGRTLIVAMPPGGKQALEGHPLVALASGLVLDEEAEGARHLKALFAGNAARQLAGRAVAGGR